MGVILSLFASPVARFSILIFGVLAVLAYVRYDAAQEARREAELEFRKAAAKQVEIETARQREAAQKAIGAAMHRAEETEAERDALKSRLDQVISDIRSAPEDPCRISDALRRELRAIQ